jgi:hypothetical protein
MREPGRYFPWQRALLVAALLVGVGITVGDVAPAFAVKSKPHTNHYRIGCRATVDSLGYVMKVWAIDAQVACASMGDYYTVSVDGPDLKEGDQLTVGFCERSGTLKGSATVTLHGDAENAGSAGGVRFTVGASLDTAGEPTWTISGVACR